MAVIQIAPQVDDLWFESELLEVLKENEKFDGVLKLLIPQNFRLYWNDLVNLNVR